MPEPALVSAPGCGSMTTIKSIFFDIGDTLGIPAFSPPPYVIVPPPLRYSFAFKKAGVPPRHSQRAARWNAARSRTQK
jgi:hypothetical protein